MPNPFFNREGKGGAGKVGRRSEKQVAKRLGGRPTPASGALDGAKGDVVVISDAIKFRIEAKSTVMQSISLKFSWLLKILHEARSTESEPALTITFTKDDGTPHIGGNWVMIPEHLFERLKELK